MGGLAMMILVGHDNYVRSELVAVVLKAGNSAVKRLRKAASGKGVLVDATSGHKTRSVLVFSTGQVVLSSLQPETVRNRLNNLKNIEGGTAMIDHWSGERREVF